MNNKKIGLFIQSLRKEKGITQEALAAMIPIGREAVSKWERGINVPDSSSLLILSDIFGVSINEILYGEKKTAENKENVERIALNIYQKNQSLTKTIKYILAVFMAIICSFLVWFFLNTYSRTVYYKINENGIIENGYFILMPDKYYFSFNLKEEISGSLYYKVSDKNKLIASGDLTNFHISENLGYNEYISQHDIEAFLENCYLEYLVDGKNNIQRIIFEKDYNNSSLFFRKATEISFVDSTNKYLKKHILEKFTHEDGIYHYTDEDITYYYEPELTTIYYKTDMEEVYYYYDINHLDVVLYEDKKVVCNYSVNNERVSINFGDCTGENSKDIINKIKKIIS